MKFNRKTLTWIFIAVGILIAIAVLWYLFGGKEVKCDPFKPGFDVKGKPSSKCNVKPPADAPPSGTSWAPDAFPLKKGMYGSKVKALQQAMIDKWGKSILPKWGADGKFGDETEAGLKSKNISIPVSEADFNSIVGTGNQTTMKGAYAKYDGAKVLDKNYAEKRTVNKDQFVGKVTDKTGQFYEIDGFELIHQDWVYLK